MDIEKNLDAPKDTTTASESAGNNRYIKPAETKVQVALRVRPFIQKEILDNEQKCVKCFTETNQV